MLERLKQFFTASHNVPSHEEDELISSLKTSIAKSARKDITLCSEEERGIYCFNLPFIRSVGIPHLEQVAEHRINHVFDTVSHIVHFNGGGVLCYSYAKSGELIEFSVKNLSIRITQKNEILVYCCDGED